MLRSTSSPAFSFRYSSPPCRPSVQLVTEREMQTWQMADQYIPYIVVIGYPGVMAVIASSVYHFFLVGGHKRAMRMNGIALQLRQTKAHR